MAHLPGHNRPFTSFLTQGMQNTNQNLNTMGLPNDPIYYPKNPNPSELPMQQNFMGTGGPKPTDKFENPSNIPIQPGFGSFGDFFNKPMPKGPSEIPMQQDFMDMGGPKPTDKIQNPIISAVDSNIDRPMYGGGQDDFLDFGVIDTSPIEDSPGLSPVAAGFDVNNDGVVNALDALAATSQYQSEDDFYIQYFSSMFPEGFDVAGDFMQNPESYFAQAASMGLNPQAEYDNYMSSYQSFLENLQGYVVSQLGAPGVQAQQFTGGGGQGGQQARQLYYPGTSGGFAGVGSGIDSSMLQNLLNRG